MARKTAGLLFVWADVDPSFEDDYNRWYDQEHVEERVRIPGFISGTRYHVVGTGRRYLGLYRTESLDVFDTAAYKAAFTHQTPWSVTNLGRMRDAMRRVCAVTCEFGGGTGAWLSVLRLGREPTVTELTALQTIGADLQKIDGVVASSLLMPDVAKSTPLPNETPGPRVLDPILLIETTSEAAAATATAAARCAISPDGPMEGAALSLMWQLHASALSDPQPDA